ncbi:MAG: SpoIIE family protein phosphatase [Muribaculaceae bacterium]|nr:SpoIIE family protein phosphatase [Muribaculaceae bacterium]
MRLANRLSLYSLIICAIIFVVTAVFVEAWTLGAEATQAEWIIAREQNEITQNIDSLHGAKYMSIRMPYKKTITIITDSTGQIRDSYPTLSASQIKDFLHIHGLGSPFITQPRKEKIDGSEYMVSGTITVDGEPIYTLTPMMSIRLNVTGMKIPLLIILALFFVLLTLTLRIVLRRSTRPLTRLAAAAERVGAGDFDAEFPAVGKHTDLQQLRNSLSGMLASIKEYMGRIENEVKKRERYESELDIARRIQASMLPEPKATIDWGSSILEVSASLEPAYEVAGDLFDYVNIGGKLYFTIGDVSGKGVGASLVMSSIRSHFHFGTQQRLTPGELMSSINRSVCERNDGNMFATMIIGMVDSEQSTLTIANAGHTYPVLISGHEVKLLHPEPGLPVGLFEETVYKEMTNSFRVGTTLFTYTDGVTEAESPQREQFGENRLLDELRNLAKLNASAEEYVEKIREAISHFSARPYSDDVTMLAVGHVQAPIYKITLGHDRRETERLREFLEETGEKLRWSDKTVFALNLIAEEAIVNVIEHSQVQAGNEGIEISISQDSHVLTLIITDKGEAFDPLANAPEVNTTLDAEEREAGGLGIFLIRNIAHDVSYRRADDKNILSITYIESPSEGRE